MSGPEMDRPREPEPDQGVGSTRPTVEKSDDQSIAARLATRLTSEHLAQLKASGIDDELILERGYESVRTLTEANDVLVDRGFSRDAKQLRTGLLIPLHGVAGGVVGNQLRPDSPRVTKDGKPIRYETPKGARMRLDVHPRVCPMLADPRAPLLITEGVKKGDAAASRGLCCVALLGVWNWRGRNEQGGTTALADWDSIALNGREVLIAFDSDAMTKRAVASALARLKAFLELRGARVRVVYLPGGENGDKVGLDDFFVGGGTVEQLFALATDVVREPPRAAPTNGATGADEQPHPRTDSANVRRLVLLHGSDLHYVPVWKRFLTWTGRKWATDDGGVRALAMTRKVAPAIRGEAVAAKTSDERDELWRWAKSSESRERRQAMLALVPAEDGIAIDHEQFDTDPMLLGVKNGVIDLRTGDLRPHTREDYITRVAPVEYLDAAAPTWNTFLERVLPDGEVRLFVQRAAGYSITGDVGGESLFFAYGSGANGKSKFLGAMLDLLGRDLSYAAPSELIAMQKHRGHPTEVAALHGKRLVTCNELDAGLRLDEARVKQLTGGDRLTARRMKEDFWDFAPTFKLWLAGNHRPRVLGTDEGIWRRLLLVPFTVTIPPEERDQHLAAKLRAELPGILRWAIDGALLWQRDGLAPPATVTAASNEYRAEQDGLADFLAARCARLRNARAGAAQLYAAYGNWCAEVGEEPVSGTLFGTMLRERGFERVVSGGRRFYVGLKLLEAVLDDAQAGAP